MQRYRIVAPLILCALLSGAARSEDPLEGVRPTPLTRPALKQLLEEVKQRTPRIPLPELSDVDDQWNNDPRSQSYESRVRLLYLNGIETNGGNSFGRSRTAGNSGGALEPRQPGQPTSRSQDPLYSLSDELKVELFWIVSRLNNCQYCIGHQESKLLRLGLSDDTIAKLDFDWTGFDPASQAAFAFAKKYTLDPHLLCDADIEELKQHFNENQILEMILSMAGNNSINRWKEAIGVPQHADGGGYSGRSEVTTNDNLPRGSYVTPTSTSIAGKPSAIVVTSDSSDRPDTCSTISRRPALESRDFVEKKLLECKTRSPRISLLDDEKTRENISSMAKVAGAIPNYARLLARFPTAGSSRVDGILSAFEKGDLNPLVKWQLAWILARQDRAWYVLGLAKMQLHSLGQTDDQIFSLDGDCSEYSPEEQALFNLAKKLGNAPVILNAGDVKKAVDLVGPRDVVQAISFVTVMAAFNRITEAAGLPLDEVAYPAVTTLIPDEVPRLRDDVKRILDASKRTTPRLPAPPLTEAERELIENQKAAEKVSGEKARRFGLANNARTRAFYLAEYGFSLQADIKRTVENVQRDSESGIDPAFRTMLFWIVSRGNNCTYCLGHQESGLASRGVTEETRAALDSDWSLFDPAQQAAFAFATKLSFEPHQLESHDFEQLRKHYSEKQVAELIVTIAGFNATNRWTGPMRIQQDVLYEFSTPTAAQFANRNSLIAPSVLTSLGHSSKAVARIRPALEDWSLIRTRLAEIRDRKSLLPLADVETTERILKEKELDPTLSTLNWVRLLSTLPKSGAERIVAYNDIKSKGTLAPRSKAVIAYVAARHDRAWYALGHAINQLQLLGFSEDQIQQLDSPSTAASAASAADAALIRFAQIITTDPALVTDRDFQNMQNHMSDKHVAEAVYIITQAAFFNRVTEACLLPLE